MSIGLPQLILIVLLCIQIGFVMAKHGKARPERYYDIKIALVADALMCGLLWWGGFFGK